VLGVCNRSRDAQKEGTGGVRKGPGSRFCRAGSGSVAAKVPEHATPRKGAPSMRSAGPGAAQRMRGKAPRVNVASGGNGRAA